MVEALGLRVNTSKAVGVRLGGYRVNTMGKCEGLVLNLGELEVKLDACP